MKGPTLRTERLELNWLTLDDAPLMLAIWNDPAFIRFVGDRGVRTIEEAETSMRDGALQLYSSYGYGPFRVTRIEDAADMGICGLFRRDGLDEPDVGFALLPEYCGKGFGFESSRAVLDHARDTLQLPAVTAIVSAENGASIGLLEKLGLYFDSVMRLPGEDSDVRLYRIEFGT